MVMIDPYLDHMFILESNEEVYQDKKLFVKYIRNILQQVEASNCIKVKKQLTWKILRSLWKNQRMISNSILFNQTIYDKLHYFAFVDDWYVARVFLHELFPTC